MGGWLHKEIRAVDDLKGLKFRIAGYGGSVLQRLGGAEWVGPYDDEKPGFNRIAPFSCDPGGWEYPPSIGMMVNAQAWEALPKPYRAVLESACAEGWHRMAARCDVRNPQAVRRLIASGTPLRGVPREVLAACHRASQEVYAEVGGQNARFTKIHGAWDKFRLELRQWFRVAEDSLASFLAVTTALR